MSDVAAWIAQLPDHQGRLLTHLRELILAALPGVAESIKWSRPCYVMPGGKPICYLHASKNHVTLGFEQGAALIDPKNLLEGTGKNMRHIKFRSDQDFDDSAIIALLKQALVIGML